MKKQKAFERRRLLSPDSSSPVLRRNHRYSSAGPALPTRSSGHRLDAVRDRVQAALMGALLLGSVTNASPGFSMATVSPRAEDGTTTASAGGGGTERQAYELSSLMDDIDALTIDEAVRNYAVLYGIQGGGSALTEAAYNISLDNRLRVFTRFRMRCGSGGGEVTHAAEDLSRRLIERGRIKDLLFVLDDPAHIPSDGTIVQLAYALILSRNFLAFSRYFHRYCVHCDLTRAEPHVVEIMKRVIAIFCEYTLDDSDMPKLRFVDSLMRSICAYHARLVACGFDAAEAESMSLLGHMEECQIVSWVDCFPMFEETVALIDAFPYAADDAYRIAESVHTDGDMIRIEDVSAELDARGANRLLYTNSEWEEYNAYSRSGTVPAGPSGSAYYDVMSSLSSHMARSGENSVGTFEGGDDLSPPTQGRDGSQGPSLAGNGVEIEISGSDSDQDDDDALYDEDDDSNYDDDDDDDDYSDDDGEDTDDSMMSSGDGLDGEYDPEDVEAAARETLENIVETTEAMASDFNASHGDLSSLVGNAGGADKRFKGIALGVNVTPQGISVTPMNTAAIMRRLSRARPVPPYRGGPDAVRRQALMARMDQLGMAAAFDFYPSSAPMVIDDVTRELCDQDASFRLEFAENIIQESVSK